MKRKKLLSTAVAGALVAAQMVMPVMAADGGSITVPVTTKTPVLRVVVPTSMEIAVNQFEMGDAGSQIYSSAFKMENQSEIPVKVTVTSTVDIETTTTLVATKAAATGSTTEGEAWLAVAAQTSAGNYIEESEKSIKDLTEASANVTTFADKKAEQVYYLNASSAMKYKLLNANEAATDIEYAQFYELHEKTFTSSKEADELNAALKDVDIYYIPTASIVDGAEITKIAKNPATPVTWGSDNTYYTLDQTATAKAGIQPNHTALYLYGDGATDSAGEAAFRYIGKLSGKNETWTNADIKEMTVAYTIVGVQQDVYNDLADQTGVLTYGLYKAPAQAPADVAPSIETTTYTMVADQAITIQVDLGSGDKAASGVDSVTFNGTNVLGTLITYNNGVVTVPASTVNNLRGKTGDQTITIVFDDDEPTSVPVTFKH